MGKRDARVDAYIEEAADFAKPILKHLRELVHGTCPEVEETIKWSSVSFVHHGILCGMAAFNAHCAFGFWKHGLLFGEHGKGKAAGAMGSFGRLTKLSDLPSDKELKGYIKEAMRLNEQGVKVPKTMRKTVKPLVMPPDLAAALKRDKKAHATFEKFPPSHKKEYVEWITEAKREETRQKRLSTTLEWLAEGKPRNWKYMNC